MNGLGIRMPSPNYHRAVALSSLTQHMGIWDGNNMHYCGDIEFFNTKER
jgi:hypothetical protein